MSEEVLLRAAGQTHTGMRRPHNEDAVLVREDLGLYAVADGAGGHLSGEVASLLALRSISNYFGATIKKTHELPEFDRLGIAQGARRLSSAVLKANRDIIDIAKQRPEHRGMGTTVVALSFSPRSGLVHVAHAGDSRCYRMRAGHLELLTQDHSLLTDVLEQRPDLDDSVFDKLPKHVVTRALGMERDLRISLRSFAVAAGDRYLLCSDGLSGPVPATDIAEVLLKSEQPESIANDLIDHANLAGGPDNVAAVVIDCSSGPKHAVPMVPPPPPAVYEMARRAEASSDPELLILGIQDLDAIGADSASDNLLRAIEELMQKQ